MDRRHKVLKGLDCCTNTYIDYEIDCESNDCPYKDERQCISSLAQDALNLLREDCHNCKIDCLLKKYDELQEKYKKLLENKDEGIEPVDDGQGSLICGNQGYECGVVGRRNIETGKIERYCNYCAMCGAKVKWE